MNLLKAAPMRALFNSKYFPIVPQLSMLLACVALFIGSITVGPHPDIASYLCVTNLSTQLLWNVWWPITLILAVTFGRVWCMVCPLELVNSLSSRIGLKKKVPLLLKSGWIITLFYAFILFIGMKYLDLARVPRNTALYLAVIFFIAVVVGLIWEKRAFCSYICPVGSLLGIYSYLSFFEWRADDPTICSQCKTKDCVSKKKYYYLFGHSCTSNIDPKRIKNNRECLLCSHCLKACPNSNFRFALRIPLADFFSKIQLNSAEICLLLIVIGFVNNAWPSLIFIICPLILCLLISRESSMSMLQAFMVMLIPVTGAAHMLHAFRGLIYNAPVWKFILSDPLGVHVASMLANNNLTIDRGVLAPAWKIMGAATYFIHGAIFVASAIIIFNSPMTERINRAGKIALTLSVASYIASFYIKIKI